MPEVEIRQTTMLFKGKGYQALGWFILIAVLHLLVIPTAWIVAGFLAWAVRSITFNDDTTASFRGRGKKVWWVFAGLIIFGYLPQLSRLVEGELQRGLVALALTFCVLPIGAELWLRVIRWTVEGIRLNFGSEMHFNGEYMPMLGWMALYTVSSMILIPVPWVIVAIVKYVYRNIEFGSNKVLFGGTGGGLFWRGLIVILPGLAVAIAAGVSMAEGADNLWLLIGIGVVAFIVTSYLLVWLARWFVRCTVISRPDDAPFVGAGGEVAE
ncbi:MAG: hypothetical protein JW941_10580 [Candidatus Coatesbacteria bacterium]|nr:hypothetical protein [Candidatus Coatesbacteria bacterium]